MPLANQIAFIRIEVTTLCDTQATAAIVRAFSSPLPFVERGWGGGRGDDGLDFGHHAIDIRQHVIIPETQDPITFGFEKIRACPIGKLFSVLTAVDLDNQLALMIGKVGNVTADLNLPTEMRAVQVQPMAQMSP